MVPSPGATTARIERDLEDGLLGTDAAVATLDGLAHDAPTLGARLAAARVLGALSGRAFDAPWPVAERAAFTLLELARDADAPAERVGLLRAMGRGTRNLWLLPYVHRRLFDADESVAAAAIAAAGGLAFPALEEVLAGTFLTAATREPLRLAALEALGRMGAESSARRVATFLEGAPNEAAVALAALTEMRSRAGEAHALKLLAGEPPPAVLEALVRYLAELGNPGVLPTLRRLARDEDGRLRSVAALASRAFKAEQARDADERILTALTERDRAVRAVLARRLRTLPVADVLTQAELLVADDPAGVVQVVAEVRAPEVTKFFLAIAADEAFDLTTRARAAFAIEADEPWEQEALAELANRSPHGAVRAAAAQTLGAFASLSFVLDRVASLATDPDATARAALLWALQLSARPGAVKPEERSRVEALLRTALTDTDGLVRRRAAYVAGNLDIRPLVGDVVELARREDDIAGRLAAFVALAEIGSAARFPDVVFLWNRETDPRALAAASRAMERCVGDAGDETPRDASRPPPSLTRVHDRLRKLLTSKDPLMRGAAVRVAGLAAGAVPNAALVALLSDAAPKVRELAAVACGRAAGVEGEAALVSALDDPDTAVQERAAEALLALGSSSAVVHVVTFVGRAFDRAVAARVAAKIGLPHVGREAFTTALEEARRRVDTDDAVYERLLELEVEALASARALPTDERSIDDAIAAAFPAWSRLKSARDFSELAKSVRTAEVLYAARGRGEGTDFSASIVLWTKALEGYLHGWLGTRLRSLQAKPHLLWDLTDNIVGRGWASYQTFVGERWRDPVAVGGAEVEVPLRSVVNVLRDFQGRKLKSLDSPASVTEWSRLILFFAVDHPAGPRDLLELHIKGADRTVKLAHRMHVLAQVRNMVTHRAVAAASTLEAFRGTYYEVFEELARSRG